MTLSITKREKEYLIKLLKGQITEEAETLLLKLHKTCEHVFDIRTNKQTGEVEAYCTKCGLPSGDINI